MGIVNEKCKKETIGVQPPPRYWITYTKLNCCCPIYWGTSMSHCFGQARGIASYVSPKGVVRDTLRRKHLFNHLLDGRVLNGEVDDGEVREQFSGDLGGFRFGHAKGDATALGGDDVAVG